VVREPFTTSVLSSATAAAPERVWQALTCASANLGVPAGLRIVSEWVAGATVRLCPARGGAHDRLCSFGEVVSSTPPRRLSYTLGAGPNGGEPTIIVTWEIAADAGGSVLTLTVDDLAPGGRDDAEARCAWERIVMSLTVTLDETARSGGSTRGQ
jgi:uncharacterized protein YndB with AHSA1/START domain